jgi:membrane-bound inhibitor of C-type lysozyme
MEALPLAAAMLGGLDVSAAVILGFNGDFERRIVRYDCGQSEPLVAEYVNAAPNFLAIVSIEGGPKLVFVTVLSASGARYAAGEYEWWTKGSEGTLANLTTPDAEPLACTEISETP